MKVACIVPGSGGQFYCQNCLRDLALVRALRARGADVLLVPLYLPLPEAGRDAAAAAPVFYGAVRVWLGHVAPPLARLAGRALDAPAVLRAAARRAGSTDAAGLASLTLSMLRGERGGQAEELDRLVAWLRDEVRPDVVHLSNALLLGLARRVRRETGAAVVCSLQDEDIWLEALPPGARAAVAAEMSARAADVARFVASSRHYAGRMAEELRLPADRVRVVYPGVEVPPAAPAAADPARPPAIGFLSRHAPGLGLDVLAEAFLLLRREPRFARLRLRAAGGCAGRADVRLVRGLRRRFARAGAADDVDWVPGLEPADRLALLRSVDVLSVPARRETAFGLYLLEAWAAGVPVVQPRTGAFPELVERTGGGLLYAPHTPEALAAALAGLLDRPDRGRALGAAGRDAVRGGLTVDHAAEATLAVYAESR